MFTCFLNHPRVDELSFRGQASREWEDVDVEVEVPVTSSRGEVVVGRYASHRPHHVRINHDPSSVSKVSGSRASTTGVTTVHADRKDTDVTGWHQLSELKEGYPFNDSI